MRDRYKVIVILAAILAAMVLGWDEDGNVLTFLRIVLAG